MESEKNKGQEDLTEFTNNPKRRTRKKKKVGRTVIIAILSVFVLVVGAGVYLINHYLNHINIIDPETESVLSPSEFARIESEYWESVNNPNYTLPDPEDDSTETDINESETAEDPVVKVVRAPYQADAYRATLSADDEQVIFDHPVTPTIVNQTTGGLHDEDLINIMLVGQDTRNTSYRERSDSMILVSINPKTHKVALISFLRDLYVPLGDGYGYNRLNNAFRIGGLKKMYQVYENVFGLHIDGGIYINFGQFMSLVNLLGGVDITLTETEAKWLRTTLEQSVPDMRYWGQIVEAKMPKIKTGTTVKDAISALLAANLTYAYADANGGAAPDDISTATVKALYLDAAGKKTAKAGTYYTMQSTIYIKYAESRITFPTIPDDASVESAVKLLTNNGFKVAYADKNGNAAPYDSKSALVTGIYKEAAGINSFTAGEKFSKDTTVYIAYAENVATVPTIPAGATVAEAESMLKAAGLAVSWSSKNGGAAPADKTKATVTGIWADQAGTKKLSAGDKLDINATVYISYEVAEETTVVEKAVMPDIPAGTTVRAAEQALTNAGFTVSYSSKNSGAAPQNPDEATVVRITSDAAGTSVISAGNEREMGTTVYITYKETAQTQPSSEEPTTEEQPTQCAHTYRDVWTSNNNGTHYRVCAKCGEGRVEESCSDYLTETGHQDATCTAEGSRTLKCSKCGYVKTEKIAALGHNYDGAAWTSNGDGTHSHSCNRCGTPETANCTYNNNGVCTVCGYTKPTETQPTQPSSTETQPESTTEAATEAPTEPSTETPAPEGGDGGQSNGGTVNLPKSYSNINLFPVQTSTVENGLYNPIVTTTAVKTTSSSSSNVPYYLRNIKAGRVHLDGMQTLAYCRMRKLDSDFKRTERQRTVLNILFNKVKTSSLATLNNLLEEILPQVTTDLSKTEILKIAANILPYFSSINLQLHSIPAEGTYAFAMINGMAVVTMNQAANINALRSWLPY